MRDGFGCFGSPVEYLGAVQAVLEGCGRHGVTPGLWAMDPTMAIQMSAMGFRFILVGGDIHMVQAGAAADVAALEAAFATVDGLEWKARERSQDLLGKRSFPPPDAAPTQHEPCRERSDEEGS